MFSDNKCPLTEQVCVCVAKSLLREDSRLQCICSAFTVHNSIILNGLERYLYICCENLNTCTIIKLLTQSQTLSSTCQ